MKVCHIDTETTGLTEAHGLIQVSGIIEIDGKAVEEFDVRMRPFKGDLVSSKALEVNGLTHEILTCLPMPAAGKAELDSIFERYVRKFDKKDKLWFVGYNAWFDWNIMQAFYKKSSDKYFGSFFFYPFIDTAVLAGMCLETERCNMKNFKLATVATKMGILYDKEKLHDALTDVKLSREIYWRFKNAARGEIVRKDNPRSDHQISMFDVGEGSRNAIRCGDAGLARECQRVCCRDRGENAGEKAEQAAREAN